MNLAYLIVVGANLRSKVSPQVGIEQTAHDAHRSGGIQHMHHGMLIGGSNLDGRMRFACGGATDE